MPSSVYTILWPFLRWRFQRRLRRFLNHGHALIILVEGWDAGGKTGTVRRLLNGFSKQLYTIHHSGPPTAEEKAQHFLWRYQAHMPAPGHVTVLDRSWYGRVLVEKVEELASPVALEASYDEINAHEAALAAQGITLVKLWLHIDGAEQARRLEARRTDPQKRHKLSPHDYRNLEMRAAYKAAAEEMFARTSSPQAPWHVVPANNKKWARVKCLAITQASLKKPS